MSKLEDLISGACVEGVIPREPVTVVSSQWFGDSVLEVTYKTADGSVANTLLYRDDEARLHISQRTRPWSFDAPGDEFRLVSEASRIRLAALFDTLLAVHTSLVEPLPHQIVAVYERMLPRQPLRFLLADDPGAGKTIMAGLFMKELMARADLERCLIVAPGRLAEQWQDELDQKFQLPFEIATNDQLEAARTGNWFGEHNLAIARLDKLSRNDDMQQRLRAAPQWDLVVVDEAHKMSASFFGNEINYTKRYRLGQLLSETTRHFLLMTATPHNGKEEDFQLFMALLDGDRFEGRFRDGVHTADCSDLMRRMVKEQLLKFDGTPLFPERRAYTVAYDLSQGEAQLYKDVTEYVREEFNRAEALESEGRKGTVGFALTILQRRLASSPEAIYQSLRRRKERLESRLREAKLLARGGKSALLETLRARELEETDQDALEGSDEATAEEIESAENEVVDEATAARTIEELEIEIEILKRLERSALDVRRSGVDRKWDELSRLLQDNPEMFDARNNRRKLIIFTEHRDTLNYLRDRVTTLSHLTLWHRVGVADHPTVDLVMAWLSGLGSGQRLSPDQLRRVRSLLPRYAVQIWQVCGHWLNLEGEWVAVENLTYKLTMQALVPWSNLFATTKSKTADLQRLPAELCDQPPFSTLVSLAASIEERIDDGLFQLEKPQRKAWLEALGRAIGRISLENKADQARVRDAAIRLAKTIWQPARNLEAVPYIDGTPAGTPRKIDVLWKEHTLYVMDQRVARAFRAIAQELARPFDRQDIADAIKACVERSPDFIVDYMEQNFSLLPEDVEAEPEEQPSGTPASSAQPPKDQPTGPLEDEQEATETPPPEPSQPTESGPDDSGTLVPDESGVEPPLPEPIVRIHTPRPAKPRFIEIFAKARGYQPDGESDRFFHADGSWLQKADGSVFPWEKYTADGHLAQSYWLKEHCLQEGPLEVGADVWQLCQDHPGAYTLVLADLEGCPLELTGERLQQLMAAGQLKLYPAGYRLVYEDGTIDRVEDLV